MKMMRNMRMRNVIHLLLSFIQDSNVFICVIIMGVSIDCNIDGIILVNLPIGICFQIAKIALKLVKYHKYSMNIMIFLVLKCLNYQKVI